MCPASRTRRMQASSSGAVSSASGREPIQGKAQRSRTRMFRRAVLAVQAGDSSRRHSRATASKLTTSRYFRVIFSILRCSPGSIPSRRTSRAFVRASLALAKVTSGKVPAPAFCACQRNCSPFSSNAPHGCPPAKTFRHRRSNGTVCPSPLPFLLVHF